MNAKKCKAIRKAVFGDRDIHVRIYMQDQMGAVRAVGRRFTYQRAKREWRDVPIRVDTKDTPWDQSGGTPKEVEEGSD